MRRVSGWSDRTPESRGAIGLAAVIGIAWLLMSAGEARATVVLADLRDDFVAGVTQGDPGADIPATGTGDWGYLSSDTVNPTLDGDGLVPMTWDVPTMVYRTVHDGGPFVDLIGTNVVGVGSDELGFHPSASNPPSFAVAGWTPGPGEAGLVSIDGLVRKGDTGGGDGVTFDVYVDGVQAFQTTLAFNDATGTAFHLETPVSSSVHFVIGPNGLGDGGVNDSTALSVTITREIPEPGTAALTVVGLALLVFRGVRPPFRPHARSR